MRFYRTSFSHIPRVPVILDRARAAVHVPLLQMNRTTPRGRRH